MHGGVPEGASPRCILHSPRAAPLRARPTACGSRLPISTAATALVHELNAFLYCSATNQCPSAYAHMSLPPGATLREEVTGGVRALSNQMGRACRTGRPKAGQMAGGITRQGEGGGEREQQKLSDCGNKCGVLPGRCGAAGGASLARAALPGLNGGLTRATAAVRRRRRCCPAAAPRRIRAWGLRRGGAGSWPHSAGGQAGAQEGRQGLTRSASKRRGTSNARPRCPAHTPSQHAEFQPAQPRSSSPSRPCRRGRCS